MKRFYPKARRAVTLTELLVVLVIISILATLAVPVYVNKVAQARVATARSEVRQIADATTHVALVHGFVVPIHILDNVPYDQNISTPRDDIRSTAAATAGAFLIEASAPTSGQTGSQPQLGDFSSNLKVRQLVEGWQGPFLQPTRVYLPPGAPSNPGAQTDDEMARDYPLDPWGRPYFMYSPVGVLGDVAPPASAGSVLPDTLSTTFNNGRITTVEAGRFDRYAVLSLGPNGYSDGLSSTLAGGLPLDDIFYQFNPTIETSYTGF